MHGAMVFGGHEKKGPHLLHEQSSTEVFVFVCASVVCVVRICHGPKFVELASCCWVLRQQPVA